MHQEIQLGDLKIELVRKRIRNLHLRIYPPTGRVRISAPMRMSLYLIKDFVLSKMTWIKEQQVRIQSIDYKPSFDKTFLAQDKKYLRLVVPPIIAKWEPILNVKVKRVGYRFMTTRWGSCTPDDASIRLSAELARKPIELLEYVVLHEMIHLLEPSHNYRFKAFMDLHMPDWRVRKAHLNGRKTSDEID